MVRKVIALFLMFLITIFVFTACSKTGTNKDSTSSSSSGVSDAEKQAETEGMEQITLRITTWADAEGAKNDMKLIEDFEKANPNIKVQYEPSPQDYHTKLKTAIASGDAPDVIACDQWPSYYPSHPFAPIDDIARQLNFDLGKYPESLLNYFRYEGKLYALPASINCTGFFYNKKLFDEAGLKYPEDGWTWDVLKEYARKLTKGEGNNKVYGVYMPPDWIGAIEPMLWGNGGALINENNEYDGVFNSAKTVEAVEWYASFFKEGLSPTPSAAKSLGGSMEMLKADKVAMVLDGHWSCQGLKETEGFDVSKIGTVPLPVGPAGIKPGVIFTTGWHMYKDSKHKIEAFKLILAMADTEAQKFNAEMGWTLPAIPSLMSEIGIDKDPLRKAFADTVSKPGFTIGRFSIYYSPLGAEIEANLKLAMEKVILGKASAQDALNEAVKALKEAEANK